MGIFIFVFIAFLGTLTLIRKRWVIPARGFIQLGMFVMGEIAFACNSRITCNNCPLSFGICPIGTTQRLAFIKTFPFYTILILISIVGLGFGTLSCGWACPVGLIQDILQTLRIKKIKIPNKFKAIRYLVLFITALLIFLELRFRLLTKSGVGIFQGYTIMLGFLLLTFAIFIKRPLCRILCPLGLIYGKLNKISPFKVHLDKKICLTCGNCNKVCISDVEPFKESNGDLCAKCFNCKKVCSVGKE